MGRFVHPHFFKYFSPVSSSMQCIKHIDPHCFLPLIVCPGQAEEVFSQMAGDFMKPVVDIVDQLLMHGVNVTVYNGQLDLIVDTMGNTALLPLRNRQEVPSSLENLCLSNPSPPLSRSRAVGERAEVGGTSWVQQAEVDRPG